MLNARREILTVVAVVLIVYGPTLLFDFTWLDDDKLVLAEQRFLRDPGNVVRAFTRDVFGSGSPAYRPALTLSLMADAMIGGAAPLGYHLTNVVLHALGAVALFLLLVELGCGASTAGLGAALFAVHPLLTQAVAWIPGRNDSLLALFAVTGTIAFVRYLHEGTRIAYAAHVALFAAALATKETAVALPLVALAYVLVLARDPLAWRRLAFLAPGWAAALAAWWALRAAALAGARPAAVTGETLLRNSRAVLELLGGVVAPIELSVYPAFSAWRTAIGVVAVLLLVALAVAAGRRRWRHVLFGAAWFVLFLLPTLAFREPAAPFDYLHHRVYLPLVGIVIAAVAIVEHARLPLSPRVASGIAVGLIVVLAGLSGWHARHFRDAVRFWTAAVEAAPDAAEAHHGFGYVLQVRGDLAAAETEYRAAIARRPKDPAESPKYHVNLGHVYEATGRLADAQREYEAALALAPTFAPAHLNLGTIRFREGRIPEAEALFLRALALDPGLVLAHVNMCAVRHVQQQFSEAERFCLRALELQPDSDRALVGLAMVNFAQARYRDAARSVAELRRRGVPVDRIIPDVVSGLRARNF